MPAHEHTNVPACAYMCLCMHEDVVTFANHLTSLSPRGSINAVPIELVRRTSLIVDGEVVRQGGK